MPPFYEYLNLVLFRDLVSRPWGFRIQGGVDVNYPLTIQRVFIGSPADEQLLRGDVIEVIDGYNVTRMTHKQVQDLIRVSGARIVLGIKRPQQSGGARPIPYTSPPPSQHRQQPPPQNSGYNTSSLNREASSLSSNRQQQKTPTPLHTFGVSYASQPVNRRPYTTMSQPVSPNIYNENDDNYYGQAKPTSNGYNKNMQDGEQEVFTPIDERRKFFSQANSPELPTGRLAQRGRTFSNTDTSKVFSSRKSPMVFGWCPSEDKIQKAKLEASRSASVMGQPSTWRASNASITSSRETSISPTMPQQQPYKAWNQQMQQAAPVPRCTSTSELERTPTRSFGNQQQPSFRNTQHQQQSLQPIRTPGQYPQQQQTPSSYQQPQMNPYNYPSSQQTYNQKPKPVDNSIMSNSSTSESSHVAVGQRQFRTSTSIRVENKSPACSSPKPYRQVVRRLSFSKENNSNFGDNISATQTSTLQNLPMRIDITNEAKTGYTEYRPAFPASYEVPSNTSNIKCYPAIERPHDPDLSRPHVYQINQPDQANNYQLTVATPVSQVAAQPKPRTPASPYGYQQSQQQSLGSFVNGNQKHFTQRPRYARSAANEALGSARYSPALSTAASSYDSRRENQTPTPLNQSLYPQMQQQPRLAHSVGANEKAAGARNAGPPPSVAASASFDSYRQTKVPTPFTLIQQGKPQKQQHLPVQTVGMEAGVTEF